MELIVLEELWNYKPIYQFKKQSWLISISLAWQFFVIIKTWAHLRDHIITFHISNAESDSIFANVFENDGKNWHFLGGRGKFWAKGPLVYRINRGLNLFKETVSRKKTGIKSGIFQIIEFGLQGSLKILHFCT